MRLVLSEEQAGERIDALLPRLVPDLTRNAAQRLITEGALTVAGRSVRKRDSFPAGTVLELTLPEPAAAEPLPQDIPLDIVYEDGDLVVINKPKGLVVHPAAGHADGTLVNALLYHCGDTLSGIGGTLRPGIVHRIDKDTSGLLVVAKNDFAHQSLSAQLRDHSMFRIYEAVVRGAPREDAGTVDAPIARHPTERKRMAVVFDREARQAVTHWEAEARYRGYTLLRCRLETGRTHQIRVHMAYIGHPVAGDPVYGGAAAGQEPERTLQGQCLHAGELEFTHPRSGARMHLTSARPAYFQAFLTKLEKRGGARGAVF